MRAGAAVRRPMSVSVALAVERDRETTARPVRSPVLLLTGKPAYVQHCLAVYILLAGPSRMAEWSWRQSIYYVIINRCCVQRLPVSVLSKVWIGWVLVLQLALPCALHACR